MDLEDTRSVIDALADQFKARFSGNILTKSRVYIELMDYGGDEIYFMDNLDDIEVKLVDVV